MKRDSFFDKFLRQLRCKKVVKHVRKDSVVCDIGCGYDASFLKKISYSIKQGIGLDKEVDNFEDSNLELKKIKVFKDIPINNETCDVVTLIAVIEHLDHPQEIMKEAFRILKERGKLILTTPTPLAKPILEFLSFKLGLVDKNEISSHKNYFWTKDVKKMLLESGFKKEGVKNHFFECYLNNLIIAQK